MFFCYSFLNKKDFLSFLLFSITLFNLSAKTQGAHASQPKELSKFSNSIASVRQGTDTCDDEKAIVAQRIKQAKTILESQLNRTIEDYAVPCIGIAGSGGSYRSVISILGFLTTLEKYKILDATSYIATVSGSSWAVGAWIAQSLSISGFKDFLRQQLATDLSMQDVDWGAVASQLYSKISYGQPINQSDAWGCLLAHVLLKGLEGDGQQVTFSSLAPKVKSGQYPFPIFTALADDTNPHEWFEFSPLEVGSQTSACWIPASGLGKRFSQGISTDPGPEQTLGYILGLAGSAFAAPFTDILHTFIDMLPQKCANFQNVFESFFDGFLSNVNELQIPPPTVFNFMKDLKGNPHAAEEHLSFFDAGVSVNVGVVPLLRRNVNVYLICDASSSATDNANNTLRDAQIYANSNNLKFPKIDFTSIGQDKVSLFYDDQDPEVPVIIYFPNQISFSMFKFQYTPDEFNQLYRYMKDAVEYSYDTVCKGISIAIDNLTKIYNRTITQ